MESERVGIPESPGGRDGRGRFLTRGGSCPLSPLQARPGSCSWPSLVDAFQVRGWPLSLGHGCLKHCVEKDSEAERKNFCSGLVTSALGEEKTMGTQSHPICWEQDTRRVGGRERGPWTAPQGLVTPGPASGAVWSSAGHGRASCSARACLISTPSPRLIWLFGLIHPHSCHVSSLCSVPAPGLGALCASPGALIATQERHREFESLAHCHTEGIGMQGGPLASGPLRGRKGALARKQDVRTGPTSERGHGGPVG